MWFLPIISTHKLQAICDIVWRKSEKKKESNGRDKDICRP